MKQTPISQFFQPNDTPQPESGALKKRRKQLLDTTNFVIDGQPVELSSQQVKVVEHAIEGKNVFFTGSAGTGKSTCLKVVIEKMQELHGKSKVYVTASTGIAGCNVGGTTLHSFVGCGLGEGSTESMVKKVMMRKDAAHRWRNAAVLIVDEISMISPKFFELMDTIGRRLRRKPKSLFGGLQLIIAGDFLQLPYVQSEEEKKKEEQVFLFETRTWELLFGRVSDVPLADSWDTVKQPSIKTKGEMVLLTQIYRQRDYAFVDMLQAFRLGKPSQAHLDLLNTRLHARLNCSDGIRPTKLFCKRIDVKMENEKELVKLVTEKKTFYAEDSGEPHGVEQLQKHCQAPKVLELKEGCQVVLLRNLDFAQGLVNGSRGVVVGFVEDVGTPIITFVSGVTTAITHAEWKIEQGEELIATRKQIPLSLCWATSIHKSMGMTLDKVVTQLGDVFEHGQCYTALSRCTSLEGLVLISFDPKCILAHPRVVAFYESLEKYL